MTRLLALLLMLLATPAAARNANPALWVVKDADTTIYLFGTIHVLPPDIAWLHGKVKAGFDAADELVIEMIAPEDGSAGRTMLARAIDADGPPLCTKMAATCPAYQVALAGLGVPAEAFERMEPWFVATTLSILPLQALGYSAETGVEKALTAAAKAAGKPVGELETFDQQIGYFDSLPEPLQVAFLNSTVEELPRLKDEMAKMVDTWAAGDAERLGAIMNESLAENPEIAKRLLADRNARWADWIKTRLDRPGTVFVAVGAGHLAGKDSVQAMLAARGVTTAQVRD